jgi:predicted esterase
LSIALQKGNGIEMIFTNGGIVVSPSPDIGDVYEGPYYSFFSWSDPPTGSELESVSAAYQLIYDVIEEEGPFDGILGFSQGATLASAFLMHHAEQHPLDLPFVHFKYAIFIGGAPPRLSDTEALLPSKGALVDIPSVHIAGKKDDAFQASVDLFNLCRKETSTFVIHELGHVIPRDPDVVGAMAKAITGLCHKATFV